MSMFLSMISLFLAGVVMGVTHPVSLGGLLVGIALINALALGKLVSSWMFYMLSLLFLGGVMVVLLFMVSVCANERFFYDDPEVMLKPFWFMLFGMAVGYPLSTKQESFSFMNSALSVFQNTQSMHFGIMVFTLILCMITVVKISKLEVGPLVKRL